MADRDAHVEELTIRDYFNKGYTYDEILALLDKYHGIRMSIATLKRRIKEYGLKRRNVEYDLASIRDKIVSLLDGPDCMGGYRHIWHTLKMEGIGVPRSTVETLLRELDPEGTEERRAHRLRRRTYRNTGPNDAWHCEGYDKLKSSSSVAGLNVPWCSKSLKKMLHTAITPFCSIHRCRRE